VQSKAAFFGEIQRDQVDTHGLTPVALAKDYSLSAFGIHPRANARRPLQEFDSRAIHKIPWFFGVNHKGLPKESQTIKRFSYQTKGKLKK
jgi:hypothetical protein